MENIANFLASSSLNMPGNLSSSATTITLASTASPFPQSFPFRIRIDDELMKVTGTPGSNQLTVTRGDGGTTAVMHLDSTTVRVILTKEALDAIVTILLNGTETSNRRALNFSSAFAVADNPTDSRVDIGIAAAGLQVIASGTFNWTASGNSHSESISLTGITQNMADLTPVVRIMQPSTSGTNIDGDPNYTSGECWAVGEWAFSRTDKATTGTPDHLTIHCGKIVNIGAGGYAVNGKWAILG